jgi:membrane protein
MVSSRHRLLSALQLGGLSPREAASRTWTKLNEHEILTRAAAISFYAMAAMVPFLALVITLTAWFLPWIARFVPSVAIKANDPHTSASNAVALLQDRLPADAASIVGHELAKLQEQPPTGVISVGTRRWSGWLRASLSESWTR